MAGGTDPVKRMADENPPTAPPADAAAEWRPRSSPVLIAISVMLGTFMEVLDTSVANVALPHIAGSLSATPEQATWVLTSYLISNAIVLPVTAWLSAVFGRKRFLLTCIVIFTLASAACGAAASLGILIFARVVQGIGGGALQPIAQAILLESFAPARRGRAMAAYSMGVIVAPILGPTLGGWITDSYSWRWIFYINLPVGFLALVMTQAFIEDPPYLRRTVLRRIDYWGLAFMAIGLATLQIVLDKGQQDDWLAAVWIRWALTLSALALAAFIARELVTDEPIVNLRILGDRNFAIGTVLITVMGVVLYSTTALLPLFLQTLLGYPALEAGLAISPRGLGALLSAIVAGRLIGIVDSRLLVAAGFGLLALSGTWMSRLTFDVAWSNIAFVTFMNGLANPLIFIALSTMSFATLRREQMGGATGIYNLMRNLGGSVGISLVATLLARRAQVHQNVLVARMTPYDPVFQRRLESLRQVLTPKVGASAAAQQALGILYKTLVAQATLLAFVDNFRLLTVLAVCSIPLAMLLKRARARPVPGAH
ncbi:MAG TPA: DHA2 family efflux MFS transporter permease subunit [Candidatus Deferrimicrobiaceae bacterium]|nr:DHA2 family efflux MFS transporter permease subunit [Candidatus Deferrimicrobiaceae bacterium]